MIDRRGALGTLAGTAAAAAAGVSPAASARPAAPNADDQPLPSGQADRAYMLAILEKMALPVLERMAEGRLQREWKPDVSPTWDGRPLAVASRFPSDRLLASMRFLPPPGAAQP